MIILTSNTGHVSLRRSSQSKKRAVNNAQKGYIVEEGDFPERPVTRSGSERVMIGEDLQKFSESRVMRTIAIGRVPIRNLPNRVPIRNLPKMVCRG
ncbi:hypothetical protein AVEN_65363-1 [Araneus ventricosus]|uniref:Uncharacterized protein n=1 Tax=Araneus ventricosus TaxID=182803 RepID=A0A4Y2KLI9_ARAVE|nr:hypothetical protein AVEN_65363-1 [Araneus ventricosus]